MTSRKRLVDDPFQYLKDNHKATKKLFKLLRAQEKEGRDRGVAFHRLDKALTLHMDLEERAVYPALKEVDDTREMTFEAVQKHHSARILLTELRTSTINTETWSTKLWVLEEQVDHHVREEERDLFPKATRALDAELKERMRTDMEQMIHNAA